MTAPNITEIVIDQPMNDQQVMVINLTMTRWCRWRLYIGLALIWLAARVIGGPVVPNLDFGDGPDKIITH